jgi:hypothetical protein
MAAVGTVPAFAPSIVLSIPRAPSWRWRRTRALRHSTRWRMCLLPSPRTRLESTSFSRPRFPTQTGSAPEFQARASSSSATSCSLQCVCRHPQCGIDQQLELDLRCRARAQSVCAVQPGTFRARCSPPSTPACGPLTSTPTLSATTPSGGGQKSDKHTLRVSTRNARHVMAERIEDGDTASTAVQATCERYNFW